MIREIRDGLSRSQKELPPKLFYDTRGSQLFEEITRLPEYYLSRTERALLEEWMPRWIASARPRSLVELGAGSAAKTRTILDAMRAAGGVQAYMPIDISAEFLEVSAQEVRRDYPELVVLPTVGDISNELEVPAHLPRPILFAFLGSTIGNFAPEAAIELLRRVRGAMAPEDRFLLGVDLRKDTAIIEAAYNDAQGVTAEFNRNMLRVLNRDFGADFDPSAFRHHAFYNEVCRCVEMHLVSVRDQTVTVPEVGAFRFREDESVRTEISCKHDRESVTEIFGAAGLRVVEWESDWGALYALALAVPSEV